MKSIVIYYTRDGHTRIAAEAIAKTLKSQIFEIQETKDRKGILGYLVAGKDALQVKKPKLVDFNPDIEQSETVIFGCPIWAWRPAPPILSAISRLDLSGKKVINFVTMGGSCGKSLDIMKQAVHKRSGVVIASFSIKTSGTSKERIAELAKEAVSGVIQEKKNKKPKKATKSQKT